MKKVLLIVLGAVGAVLAKKKLDESRTERALWAESTDPVNRA